MLLSLEGEESCGKTTLAYTAPRPIVGFAFDMGVERALYGGMHKELFADLDIQIIERKDTLEGPLPNFDHDITVFELPQPIQLDTFLIKGCEELWGTFLTLLVDAIKNPKVKTVVVDTMTIARRIRADAYLQGLQANTKVDSSPRERLLQIEYGATNDSIRGIYTTVSGVKKHLVAIHHLTDERAETISATGQVQQSLTGKRILEGLTQTYRFVDVAVRNEIGASGEGKVMLTSVFQKCGYNLSLIGAPCQNATWDKISQMIEDTLGGSLKLERANG